MSHNLFLQAINDKLLLSLCFDSFEKGTITRKCVAFDFGPSNRYKDGKDRYHLYDLDSPNGKHNLAILPHQIVSIILLDENFDPTDYITWATKWHYKRDWGILS